MTADREPLTIVRRQRFAVMFIEKKDAK